MNTHLRFALEALDSKDEPILVYMELDIDKLEVHVRHQDSKTLAEDAIKDLINKWNNSEAIDESILSEDKIVKFTDESILPEDIKVKNSFLLRQTQNEWSYAILNAKLFQQFNLELDVLKQKVSEISEYSADLFKEAKEFWEKLLDYKKEKEITQDKLNFFKEEVNVIFDKLKLLKEKYLLEMDEVSNKVLKEYSEKIEAIYENLKAKDVHFNTQINALKEMQLTLKDVDAKRDVKNQLFKEFQKLFESIQETRKEKLGNGGSNVGSRIDGLNNAKNKITKSLEYDLKDLNFNEKKIAQANNKLEEQLREAKINVLKDRIESKKTKLADIQKTIDKLTKNQNDKSETQSPEPKSEVEEAVESKTEEVNEVVENNDVEQSGSIEENTINE